MTVAKGIIKHENWVEKTYHEAGSQKSTLAEIDCGFTGDLVAAAVTRFLMQYVNDTTCHYSGFLLVDGTLDGHAGSFILSETGIWTNGVASSTWQIVEGSGTAGLTGISGSGTYAAEHDKTVRYTIDYQLDATTKS